ncbi:MAG: urea ABC transporter permease subunit UrtC [Limnothrix sp. RL_2_0]|nr:urea ABC transporter permease subunit UrtC [Limnothrix sp. RL_2_0]
MNVVLSRRDKEKKSRTRLFIEAGVIVALMILTMVVLPLVLEDFRLKLVGRFLAMAIVALGIDLIWGYTGLLSLGHGIFFALGGYAFAMYLNLQLPEGEMPEFFMLYGVEKLPIFWEPFRSLPFTLIAMVVIPGIIAGILGYLVFRNRIKGVYFSIITQAALLVFFNFFNGQQKLINGTNGLKTDSSFFFGQRVGEPSTQLIFYEITIVCVLLVYLLCRWLTSGRFGRLLIAIRDDETRVRFTGYDPTWFKVVVFAISGAIAGISGALYTVQSGIITPNFMEVSFSIEMVIAVAVGGRGTLSGAILGTILVNAVRTYLSESFPEIWLFFQGALFLIVVTVLPDGIVGWVKDVLLVQIRRLTGRDHPLTYPAIAEDPVIQSEKEQLTKDEV